MLHWGVRLRLLLKVMLGIVVGAMACGVAYEQWSRHRAWEAFPPPGEMIEVDGAAMHLHCTGTGSPTVVIEAGLDSSGAFSWRDVQPLLAETTRVCSYNRGGIVWSEARARPRDAHRITDELHALLATAEEEPPYVMVGHSIGGLLIRVFDLRFEGEVDGFVFVDSSHPAQWDRLPDEMRESEGFTPPFVWTRFAAAVGLTRLTMPPARSPQNAAHAFAPQSGVGMRGEADAVLTVSKQAAKNESLGDRPLVVLTAGDRRRGRTSQDAHEQWERTWKELQVDLATLSTDSDWRVVRHAGHYVHLRAPEAVVAAVEDVVTAVRDDAPVRKERAEP